jgi:hypothetical protein
MIKNTVEKFWASIDQSNGPDSCWNMNIGRDRDGYNHFRLHGKEWKAHRLACLLDGRDPTGWVVMHSCDNPSCVNPSHLSLGTQQDNNRDMDIKRRRRGNNISTMGHGRAFGRKSRGLKLKYI